MKQSLSYVQRLHRREDFESALKVKPITEKWLAIHWEQNLTGKDRLGIVVSKRTIPQASKRNRIKRHIRELFRTSVYSKASSLNVVVRLRRNVLTDEISEFRQAASRLLMKVRLTQNDSPNSIVNKGLSISD